MKWILRAAMLSAALWAVPAAPAQAQGAIIRATTSQAPTRISAPATRYPEELRRARVEGTVIVEARIDSTGQVQSGSIRIVESPDPRFDEAAREFVEKSRYRAGRAGGRRVAMVIRVPVLFDLDRWQ